MKEILKKIILEGIIIGLIVGLANYYAISKIEENNTQELKQLRAGLHGFWLLKTYTEKSNYIPYEEMELIDIVSLSIDRNLSIDGVAYKWKEISREGKITYPRELRSKSTIKGSLIDNKVLLNFKDRNPEGKESIFILEGTLLSNNEISGNFFSDVAFQSGKFCAKKINLEELESEEIPENFCEIKGGE